MTLLHAPRELSKIVRNGETCYGDRLKIILLSRWQCISCGQDDVHKVLNCFPNKRCSGLLRSFRMSIDSQVHQLSAKQELSLGCVDFNEISLFTNLSTRLHALTGFLLSKSTSKPFKINNQNLQNATYTNLLMIAQLQTSLHMIGLISCMAESVCSCYCNAE